jgi:hypothetical protein
MMSVCRCWGGGSRFSWRCERSSRLGCKLQIQ